MSSWWWDRRSGSRWRRTQGCEGGALAALVLAASGRFCRTAHEVLLDNALVAALAFALLFAGIAGAENVIVHNKIA